MINELSYLVKSEDLFGSLSDESEKPDNRIIEVNLNSSLNNIINGFNKFIHEYWYFSVDLTRVLNIVPEKYNSQDIEEFMKILKYYENTKYFSDYSGLYISGLINMCKDDKIILSTKHLNDFPDRIGYYNNGKTIIVNGNVGDLLGLCMVEGVIIVNGNCRSDVTPRGGNVYINGDYESIRRGLTSGNIYQNGRQIIKNGKAIFGETIKWDNHY